MALPTGVKTGLFPPSKRSGLLFHGFLILVLACASGWGFWSLSATSIGPRFVVFVVLGIGLFAPIPLLGYRAYALFRSQYILDRDSLELRWGLRNEVIPLSDILWVRSVNDLTRPINLPPIRMPGAVLGLRRHPDLGVVEFLASQTKDLLLVGTPNRIFAISPNDPVDFAGTFGRAVELGSLKTAKPKSLYPSFVFAQAWESGLVRFLWLSSFFLNVGLATWISLLIPTNARFALGFRPDRTPDAVPSVQLVILPLVSALLTFIGWVGGLFFYRWEKRRPLSLTLWISGTITGLLFLLAVLFIVTTPV